MKFYTRLQLNQLHRSGGFALVIALSLMAFVLLLLLSITTLVKVESQSAEIASARLEAEQAALLGIYVALGDLQRYAGPDQLVTATADIDSGAADGNKQWVGAWDTRSVNRFDPAGTRQFERWLVSSPDQASAEVLGYPTIGISPDGTSAVRIFEGLDTNGNLDTSRSVNAQLVVCDSSGKSKNAFAFWVEDEGVKAKVSWNESEERAVAITNGLGFSALQQSRLSSLPGPDLRVFGAGFEDKLSYPLHDSGNSTFLEKIGKLVSYNQLEFYKGSGVDDWLNLVRHDLTINSYGLLTDVMNGGLKKDLTLAFEMDGDAENPNLATNFNARIGEFVGSGNRSADPKTALQRVANQNFNSRYLFAEDVAGKTVRGPTWHLIRDYYNFYKRIESSASGFVFDPEPFYPNSSEFNQIDDTVLFHNSRFARGDDGYGEEIEPTGIYRYMPTRGSYTPILLGYRLAFTLKVINWDSITEEGDLALVLDPFFYLWNPYDQSIRFENVKVRYTVKMPIHFSIAIDGITYEAQLNEFVTSNFSGLQNFETFLNNNGEDYTMEPGAITVFSSSQVGTTTESWPGPQLNDASGLTLVNHPKTGAPLRVTKDSLVNVEMTVEIRPGAGWFITDVFNVDDADYAASAGSFPFEPVGASRMQRMFINLASPLGTNANWSRTVTQNNISVDGDLVFENGGVWDYDFKYSIGYFDNLMKGTLENGDGTMHVAPFAHFNPTSSFHVLHWRWVPLNRFSFLTSEPNLNSMLPEAINVGQAFWGKSYASSGNVTSVPVREIPTSPIVSLAGLSSADIGHYVFDPVRVVGSSGANPLIPLDNFYDSSSSHLVHDTAWLANDALWDSYYFSGIVPDYSIGGAGYSLNGDMESSLTAFFDPSVVSKHLNSRIKPYIAAGDVAAKVNALDPATSSDGYRMLSANAVMDGAFNVNSTSVDAWKAILSANRSIRLQASDGSDVSPNGDRAPFPKSAQPLDSESDEWRGYASLGEDEISQLADAIVDQIRLRGPFMSLSDFVNRRLENDVTGSRGALQAAIDSLAVNSGVAASSGVSLDYSSPLFLSGSSFAGSSSASAIGGYLMQSDLLRSIGSLLTVRSDTFRITAYGESTDLVTGEKVIARCEALVQRLPEYVDSVNSPDDALSDLEPINLQFGRRFKVMSFNWIN